MQTYSMVLLSEALILLILGAISPAQCFSRRSSLSSFSLTASSFFNLHPMPRTLRVSILARRSRYSNQLLSMHMGHSHSHDHLHPTSSNNNQNSFEAFMATVQEFQPRKFIFRRRRLVAMILFLAAAIFGPSLVFRSSGRRAALGRSDVTIFGVAVAAVTAAEPIRNAVLQMIQRLRSLQQGIANHSAPITASYLFANKNAADRVTLLGYVRNRANP
jgi:hypothetical protein